MKRYLKESKVKSKKPRKEPEIVDKSRVSYKEASSDDEFACKNFMYSSDEDSDVEKRKKHDRKRKAKGEDVGDDVEGKLESDNDGSDNDSGSNGSAPEYRIQYVLGRKEMTPKEWITICDKMYTHEITRGSVWQQPDEEYFDPSEKPLEKFLIKWVHASFLHISWETEKDLLSLVGSTTKKAIKKYRLREYYGVDLFEDLSKGEYFLPANMQVDRVLDVSDDSVNISTIDFMNVPMPTFTPASPAASIKETEPTPSEEEKETATASAAEGEEEDMEQSNEESESNEEEEGDSEEDEEDEDELVEWANDVSEKDKQQKKEQKQPEVIDMTTEDDLNAEEQQEEDLNGKLVIIKNGKRIIPKERKSRNSSGKREKKEKKTGTNRLKKTKKTVNEYLHSSECWLTVKWGGLSYSEVSFENVNDLMRMGVEYEGPLRSFYRREQLPPKSVKAADETVERARNALLHPEVISNNSKQPVFLEGAELRDYQWEGVRWLLFNWCQGRNSILADEMGLGKTVQTAAFLQMLKNHGNCSGPFLIVAPLSTLVNWQREISLWTDMDAIVYHGSAEDRELIREYEFKFVGENNNKKKTGKGKNEQKQDKGYKIEVIITSPETCLVGDSKSATGRMRRELSKIHWDVVVIDEAHKLKNFESKFTATLREEYSYNNSLLLTGTPLQNNTDELWTLLNFIDREEFEDREQFAVEFGELKSSAQLESLHKKLKPYLLRREKENVEKTVPPKVEVIIEIELTVTQKQYYRAIYEQKTDFLYKGAAKDGPNLTNLAMELRKCCNHPFLIKGAETELSKHFEGDSKVDVMIKTSGKLTLLDKLLPKLKADGHRVLIFSQFRIMLNILEEYLDHRAFTYERVDGSITGKKRQSAIDRYCKGNSVNGYAKENDLFCMLLSTRAGGVGINLTAADVVIIFDSDWNPQNDLQAQARAHRIGQTKEVKVYRLLTKKTYETVMFRAASIKLGLDYAVMHNMKGSGPTDTSSLVTTGKKGRGGAGKKELSSAVAGITTERAEHASDISKRELENLLKHGAYDIFREEQEGLGNTESTRFCEETIDQILSHSSVIVHNENAKSVVTNNSFSKASFVQGGDNAVAIDDPEFWSKVVGLSEADQAIYDGTKQRRCRELVSSYKEPGMSIAKLLASNDSSDSEEDGSTPKDKKRVKKDKDQIVPGDYSAANLNSLLLSLVSRGYGNWEAVRRDSKLRWTLSDIAKGCRLCVLQLLYWSCLSPPAAPAAKKTSSTANLEEATEAMEVTEVATATLSEAVSESSAAFSEDTLYLDSFLRKFKACRLALAAQLRDVNTTEGTQLMESETVEQSTSTEVCEDVILREAEVSLNNCSISAPIDIPAAVPPVEGGENEEEGEETSPEEETATKAVSRPLPLTFMKCFDNESGSSELQASTYLPSLLNVLKSLPLPAEFSSFETEKDKVLKVRSSARSRLLQIEDLFELFLAALFIKSELPAEKLLPASSPSSDGITGAVDSEEAASPSATDQMSVAEEVQEEVLPTVKRALLMDTVVNSEYFKDPKNSYLPSVGASSAGGGSSNSGPTEDGNAPSTETDELQQPCDAEEQEGNNNECNDNNEWTWQHDQMLIVCVSKIGYPEGKRKLAQIEERFESLSVSARCKEAFLSGKFLSKRVKDLAGALRHYSSPPAPPAAAPEKKEKDNSAKIAANEKKFVLTVLKTVQRVGRPHSTYSALAELLAARATEGQVVDLLGDSASTASTAAASAGPGEAVLSTCGIQYLLTWEQLAAECVSGVAPQQLQFIETGADRVQEIVNEIVSVYNKPEEFTEPTAVVQTGLLKDIQFKAIEACMEKAHALHQLRRVLSCYSEADLAGFISKFCKSTLPLTSPKRDASMPVWWSVKHDILLLKLSLQYGSGNQKKIIADPLVASAPADFVMPARIGSVEWVTVLTPKTIEKRVAAVLKSIPPFTHLALPAESASDKIRVAPEPVNSKKAAGSISMMSKFSAAGAGADPFKERVFGVKPIWAPVKPPTAASAASPKSSEVTPSTPVTVELEEIDRATPSSEAPSAAAPSQCSTPVPMLLTEDNPPPLTPSVAATPLNSTASGGVACPATPLSTSSSYFVTSPMSEALNENSLFSLPAFAAEAYVEPTPSSTTLSASLTDALLNARPLTSAATTTTTTSTSGVALPHSISSDSIDMMGKDQPFTGTKPDSKTTTTTATVTPGKRNAEAAGSDTKKKAAKRAKKDTVAVATPSKDQREVVDMTLEETPTGSSATVVAEVTPATKADKTNVSKKNKIPIAPAVPVKPAASIMSFFKKL